MEKHDLDFMKEAIAWGNDCHPIKESIPKVGAIIAVGEKVLGRGRRGTGKQGDDDHAELDALKNVEDKNKPLLAEGTLYTTLEPCTGRVRSVAELSCTELIRQHKIKTVFVGILDPNEGVTGKGLWRLQEAGIEVALFPHKLAKEILIQNAAFIRSQQTLSATIVSPRDGQELRTYESGGRFPIRFECLNPPGTNTYLLIYRAGLYWPQSGPFREIKKGTWEIDAHFGVTGEHVLQLVTADSLGSALIRYYRTVVEQNRRRREKLRGKIDLSLLGGDHPGIEMNGLPKGLRLEAFVNVNVVYKVSLIATSAEPKTIRRGQTLRIAYEIESSEDTAMDIAKGIWLGASFYANKLFHDTRQDRAISLSKGKHTYNRDLTIPKDSPSGEQNLDTSVWRGVVGDSTKSKWIAGAPPISIKVAD